MTSIKTSTLSLAVMSAVAFASLTPAIAADSKEKCFGVAKAGENSCAAVNGSHSCSGQSKTDYDGHEWKTVDLGTCEKMGGKTAAFTGVGKPKDLTKGG